MPTDIGADRAVAALVEAGLRLTPLLALAALLLTAANLSGFLHGFVLFCSLPLDLGVPFGGFDAVGAGVAVLLWLCLFQVIVLAGYSATLALSRWLADRAGGRGVAD